MNTQNTDNSTVFQKGGGGTNFEQYVQAAFLATMVMKGNTPCIPENEITEIVLQSKNRGWYTDDLLVIAKSRVVTHQLLIQSKHNIVFTENELFNEVINAFWKDYNNPNFIKETDRLIISKNRLNNTEKKYIKSLLNYAKTHTSENDFLSEVKRIDAIQERLNIFKAVIERANGNTPVADVELWKFLRCFDILGYDFLDQGSLDETNLLNLIKLSKSPSSEKTEKDIWNSIVTSITKHNPTGGSYTKDSIKQLEFYNDFDLAQIEPAYKSVQKLISDGNAIMKPIKTLIGVPEYGYHLSRNRIFNLLKSKLHESNIILVTGKAGAGKSAIVKDFIDKAVVNFPIIAFKADQFNKPHLANVLADIGVPHTLADVFACFSLHPDKFIFIDSLEKLLEDSDPDNAFKQLLAFADQFGIKIIGTSRKYAVELLVQKYGIAVSHLGLIEISPLTDDELSEVESSLPVLANPLSNKNIKNLLRSPKYLDFTLRSIQHSQQDFTLFSLSDFKNKLWSTLVCNSSHRTNGLPAKREYAFMEIAVTRAKEMKLFIKPANVDEEAIDLLENDDIIFQDGTNRKYAPYHDILEDWALVKHVQTNYEEHSSDISLFLHNLGNQPAIRRAFRLWIEDVLIDNKALVASLLNSALGDAKIEDYWADELLIAILKSDDCRSFFTTFEKELLAENGEFLNRCMHLIKTACKENNYEVGDTPRLLPSGSGWKHALNFIQKNVASLNHLRNPILEFLDHWEYRLVFQYPKDENELNVAKIVVLYYVEQIENGDEFWLKRERDRHQKLLISILLDLAGIAKSEIANLVKRALDGVEKKGNWQLRSFYKIVLEALLGGIRTQRVCLHLPDLIIDAAWKYWKYKPPVFDPEDFENTSIAQYIGASLDQQHCWGIENRFTTFPSGIYKTPVYNLLTFHPAKAIAFITEFINYSVEFYVKANCRLKHPITEIQLQLNDGNTTSLWAGWELWVAYRGLSVTDYLLECLLMSLEKHLLEIASSKKQSNRSFLKTVYEYIYTHSNSVMPLGVLTSVATAYPSEIEDAILPLVLLKEMYGWESSRPLQELSALAMYDTNIPFAQKERWESNQLPHRRKYPRGFADALVDYQLTNGKINTQIHANIDKMWSEAKPDDVLWRKKLTEIDTRKWRASELENSTGHYLIQPQYEESVQEFMDTGKEEMNIAEKASSYSLKLAKVYEKQEQIDLEAWRVYYSYFSTLTAIDILRDKPVTFAHVGLRDFAENLSLEEIGWCVQTLCKTIGLIAADTRNGNFHISREYNLMEKDIALNSFHLLFNCLTESDQEDELTFMMLFTLIVPFAEHEIEKLTNYIRHVFSSLHPEITDRLWQAMIHYSEFIKKNQYYHDDHDQNRLNEGREKEFNFLKGLCQNNSHLPTNTTLLNFNQFEAHYLAIAFCIIPPTTKVDSHAEFMQKFITLVCEDLDKEEDYSVKSNRRSQIHYRIKFHIEKCLAENILFGGEAMSKDLIDLLSSLVFKIKIAQRFKKGELLKFASKTFDQVIYELEKSISIHENSASSHILINNFWIRWNYLYDITLKSKTDYFRNILLLDTDNSWTEEQDHSLILANHIEDYKKRVYEFGKTNCQSVIRILSTIGRKEFLPYGLTWVTDTLKDYPKQLENINNASTERLIKTLYYNHINTIKKNQKLVDDLIWLLNKMIQMGNSTAYLFRENVIVYKKNTC